MLFANGSQGFLRKIFSQPYESRPQTTVDIRNFAVDQAADENVLIAPYQAGSPKNILAIRMRPPASADGEPATASAKLGTGPLPLSKTTPCCRTKLRASMLMRIPPGRSDVPNAMELGPVRSQMQDSRGSSIRDRALNFELQFARPLK